MMQLVASIVFALASIGLVVAAPAQIAKREDWKTAVGWDGTVLPPTAIGTPLNASYADSAVQPDNIGGVYICSDINWGGKCGYAVQPLNTCIKLGSDWNNQISSFGPDQGTRCWAYDDGNCELTGVDSWVFVYPGDATGGLSGNPIGGPWNDKISSFLCLAS